MNDYRDGSRFLDFTYIRPPFRISIEIDGFGPHQKNASRRKFSDDRFRQNQLVLDDWIVVRFSYDDLRERPRQCQQFIQQLLGKFYGLGRTDALYLQLSSPARELLRWAQRRVNGAAFSPKDARKLLWVSAPTARKNFNQQSSASFKINRASFWRSTHTFLPTDKRWSQALVVRLVAR